jgi:hypothetical protein
VKAQHLRRIERAEALAGLACAPDGARQGREALAALGVDLTRLSLAELTRLERLAETWPDDSPIPAAAIVATLDLRR